MRTNKIKYLVAILCATVLIACQKEETPVAQGADYTYVPKPGTTPTEKKIYDLYENYGVIFMSEFPRTFYDWNLVNNERTFHELTMVEDQSKLADKIDFLKTNWLSAYPDNFIKQKFPLRIFLVDSIRYTTESLLQWWHETGDDNYKPQDTLSMPGTNNITLARMGNTFDTEDKDLLVKKFNITLMADYLFAKGYLTMKDAFYNVSGLKLYSEQRNNLDFMGNGFFEQADPYGGISETFPSMEKDLKDYVTFYIMTPSSEVESKIGSYPKMMEKYQMIKSYIEALGIRY